MTEVYTHGGLVFNRVDKGTTIRGTLPLFLYPETWERHQLSREDVFHILACYHPEDLTTLLVLLGQNLQPSFVKMNFCAANAVHHSTKTIIRNNLKPAIERRVPQGRTSKLDTKQTRFDPALPTHKIPTEWKSLRPFQDIVTFRGAQYVLFQVLPSGDCWFKRVVPTGDLIHSGRPTDSLASRPTQIPGGFSLVDESFIGR